jgi:hypothetical protein
LGARISKWAWLTGPSHTYTLKNVTVSELAFDVGDRPGDPPRLTVGLKFDALRETSAGGATECFNVTATNLCA